MQQGSVLDKLLQHLLYIRNFGLDEAAFCSLTSSYDIQLTSSTEDATFVGCDWKFNTSEVSAVSIACCDRVERVKETCSIDGTPTVQKC